MNGLGGEPSGSAPTAPGLLESLGHGILRVATSRNVGVATLLILGGFALLMRRHAKRWPTQSEVIAFALAMLGLPTASTIFATLVLLPPPPEASEDSLVIAGLIGTVAVFMESCSTIAKSLAKLNPKPVATTARPPSLTGNADLPPNSER